MSRACCPAEIAAHAHPPRCSCTDDAAHRTETATKRIHARVLHRSKVLLVEAFRVAACGLEKNSRSSVEPGYLKLRRVNLRQLQDGDSNTNDKETHDEGNDLACWGVETLEEHDGGNDREKGDCEPSDNES